MEESPKILVVHLPTVLECGGQFPLEAIFSLLDRSLHCVAVLLDDFFLSILEGFKAHHEDVGQEEEAARSGVVLVGPAEDFLGHQFAEEGSGEVDEMTEYWQWGGLGRQASKSGCTHHLDG